MVANIIIEYTNVGIYKHAKLEIPPGKLIIIKGENNNGKSLLFYSLELMLMNDPLAKTLINNDALKEDPNAEMCITITQGDTKIEMHRSVNEMYYVVNGGKPITKLNKANIFNRVENIQVPGFIYTPKIDIPLFNMHGEDRGFFPLSYNDQGVFTLYEQLLGLINSKVIIKQTQAEIADTTSKIKTIEAMQANEATKQSTITKCLDHTDANALQSYVTDIEALQSTVQNLENVNSTVKVISDSIPEHINTLIAYSELKQTIKLYTELQSALDTILIAKGALSSVKPLQTLTIPETFKVQIETYKALKELLDRVKIAKTELKYYKVKQAELETALAQLEQQAHSYDICPLCGHIKEETCQQ